MKNWGDEERKALTDFVKAIKIELIKKDLEKKDFAEMMGISNSRLSMLFNTKERRAIWTVRELNNITKFLGISTDKFIKTEDKVSFA